MTTQLWEKVFLCPFFPSAFQRPVSVFSVCNVTVPSFYSVVDLPIPPSGNSSNSSNCNNCNNINNKLRGHVGSRLPPNQSSRVEHGSTFSASLRLDRRTKGHSHYQQRPTLLPTIWRSTSHQQAPELHLGSSCTTSCQRYLVPRARVVSRRTCGFRGVHRASSVPRCSLRLSLNTLHLLFPCLTREWVHRLEMNWDIGCPQLFG